MISNTNNTHRQGVKILARVDSYATDSTNLGVEGIIGFGVRRPFAAANAWPRVRAAGSDGGT